MSSLIETIDALGTALGEPKAPRLEYVQSFPRRFDPHTLSQVEKDLRKWAAEGDVYAQEALELLELS